MAKRRCKWIYLVVNPSTARKSEHVSKTVALKRAKARAKRERGEVAVEKACLLPGHVFSYNAPGTGVVWRSEWRSRGAR